MKIYVVTHENINLTLPADYELFQVGAAVNGAFCEHNDAVGEDNISAKNPNYCELTAAYWIWKNDHENDIVGLMHYRRFLTNYRFAKLNKDLAKYLVSVSEIKTLLESHDYISTPLFKNKPNVKRVLLDTVREEDFVLLRQTIEKIFPEYIETFDKVFRGRFTYFCNIFITRKSEWDKYYSWLFTIFDEMEKHVDMTGYSKQEQRLYGYLSERLFTVYVQANNKNVKSLHALFPKKPFFTRVCNKLKRIIHKEI